MPQGWRPTHPGDPTPGLSKAGRLVIVIAVAVGVAIALMVIAVRPAGASGGVASQATSQGPSPPPWFGGRVEMPEHRFALALPSDWLYADALVVPDDWWDLDNGPPADQARGLPRAWRSTHRPDRHRDVGRGRALQGLRVVGRLCAGLCQRHPTRPSCGRVGAFPPGRAHPAVPQSCTTYCMTMAGTGGTT